MNSLKDANAARGGDDKVCLLEARLESGGGVRFAGDRLGVLVGSAAAALSAFVVLHFSLPQRAARGSAVRPGVPAAN